MTEKCAWCGITIDYEKMERACADETGSGAEFCCPACKGYWEISDLIRGLIEDIRKIGNHIGIEYD